MSYRCHGAPTIARLIASASPLANSEFGHQRAGCSDLANHVRGVYARPVELALYQPDIAGNVGTIIRLAACFAVPLHIIEPCGFAFGERSLRRASMDYAAGAAVTRHADWDAFARDSQARGKRIVLMTTRGATRLPDATFATGDILLFGSEGSGVPDHVHAAAALRIAIPMVPEHRSLNVAVSAGIALAEALRQTGGFPA